MRGSESVIESLLRNRQDEIAAETANLYQNDMVGSVNDLLIYAVDNSNEYFLKQAFREPEPLFTEDILRDNSIIFKLLERLANCSDIELILNILLRAQFERWTQDQAK